MLNIGRHRMVILRRRAIRRERVFRDRTNPLEIYDDQQLIERYRFNRQSILRLTDVLMESLESSTFRNFALTPVLKVLVALRYFASGSFQGVIGDTFGIAQPTVSRAIYCVSYALVQKSSQYIKFPVEPRLSEIKRKFYTVAHFPNVIGLIDGTHVKLIAPSLHEEQYVNRKGYHSINVQVIVDSDDKFINIVAKWPGSSHDSRVFRESGVYRNLENGTIDGYLLGDSGYPCKPFLLTPYLRTQTRQEMRFNRAHKVTRCAVERTIGQWKRRFHCLHSEIRLSPSRTCRTIVACGVLHNFAKDNNVPMDENNGDDEDDDDDMEEVATVDEGGSGFLLRQRVTQLHF